MKANEAPEKIYMNWVNYPLEEIQVEYTRTDAFVKKACDWFRTLDDKEPPYKTTEEFIEDFKKYMEGE